VANAEYSATNVIPPVGAIAAVKMLPCHISHFTSYSSLGVTKKGKSYTTYCSRSWCKKTTMPYLPIRTLRFTMGKNQQLPL